MDGAQSIVDEPTSLEWPVESSAAFVGRARRRSRGEPEESAEVSDESLWTRSRDFDWGD